MAQDEFNIRNEDFHQRTHRSFVRQKFMATLGAQLHAVEPGYVEIHLPFQSGLTQQHGFFHGGALGAVADSAGGYAAFTLLSAKDSILTVEYKLNFMVPADGDLVIARGQVLRAGRKLCICRSEISVRKGGIEQPCVTMLGTFMVMADIGDGTRGR